MIYTEHEYLAHHGVDKQKWGHRNGPPYPLRPEQMSQAQKKANASESWFKRKLRESKEKKEAKKVEAKLAKQAHKEGRLSEKDRRDIYNKADVRTAYKHKSEMSNRDIEAILRRYEIHQQLNQKVANLDYKDKMRGAEKLEQAAKYLNAAVNVGKGAINIYNMTAAVANAFGDKDWKPIKFGDFGGGKKDKNNQNNKGKGNN